MPRADRACRSPFVNVKPMRFSLLAAAVFAACAFSATAAAQTEAADAPTPVDQPYAGTLTVDVDLTDAGKRIFRSHETIPVKPGATTLFYPKWIPGEHAPSGPVQNASGLIIRANGKQLPWRRDLRDMYAIHVDVPQDANQLDVQFQFLSPGEGEGSNFGASVSASPNLVDMEFNQVAFYPAGYYSRQIQIQPT